MQPDLRSAAASSDCPAVTVLQTVPAKPENWFETYHLPSTLLAKASTGAGKTPQEMLANAEAAVEALHDAFVVELQRAVDRLTDMHARLSEGQIHAASSTRQLFRIAHEVKGQGRTFGFDLASAICEALCALLDRADPHHPKLAQSISTHIEALRLVNNRRLHGDGGEVGTTLVQSLWQEVQVVGGPASTNGADHAPGQPAES